MDGTPLQYRPLTVTEYLNGVREEQDPASSEDPRILFPNPGQAGHAMGARIRASYPVQLHPCLRRLWQLAIGYDDSCSPRAEL